MNTHDKTILGNFYAYSREVLKALATLEHFMNDQEYKKLVEENQEYFKKNKLPKSFKQYLAELEDIY